LDRCCQCGPEVRAAALRYGHALKLCKIQRVTHGAVLF